MRSVASSTVAVGAPAPDFTLHAVGGQVDLPTVDEIVAELEKLEGAA